MYNPAKFKSTDFAAAVAFMERWPFATLITAPTGGQAGEPPQVSHLPLTPRKAGEGYELIGHLARANPHARAFGEPAARVTAVFHGPHAFITPAWYAEGDVPTWNYSVVHARGVVERIDDFAGIVDCLQTLTDHTERNYPSGWKFELPPDLSDPQVLTRAIAGFRIRIEDFEFKRKLSQNRSPVDRVGVIRGLAERGDAASLEVREDMRKLYSADGELR